MNTAVLLLVFNRPETTVRILQEIRTARPERLYVAADGPRQNSGNDLELCRKVRQITTSIDWQCEVKTRFLEKNLGCKDAVHSALNWFFEHEEQGIILEDDCLPDNSFFRFCEEMLEKYQNDTRIMTISGSNFQPLNEIENSYYFSRYPNIWGWATWRRAWQLYDFTMTAWPEFRQNKVFLEMFDRRTLRFWQNIFDRTHGTLVNSWAYPWTFSCLTHKGLSILPSVNLVSNIGELTEGTHTNKFLDPYMEFPRSTLKFPLIHPDKIKSNREYDILFEKIQNPGILTWLVRISRYFIYALFHKDVSVKKIFHEVYGKVKGRLYKKKSA